MEIYGNEPSIHAVGAMKNTRVTRKKIRDVNFLSHEIENKPKSLLARNPGSYPSCQQSDPEDFIGDEVSPPQHHPAHFPVHSPHFFISTSLGTAATPTSTIPVLTGVTAGSTALQVTGNCDRFH